MERLEIFKNELELIKVDSIKNFTISMLEKIPEYFFKIPASTTGKYHPAYALGIGGLVRHTKAVVGIAKELFTVSKFSELEQSQIISALILHDSCKCGINGTEDSYSVATHPLEAVKLIKDNVTMTEDMEIICGLIASHMGQWNRDYKTNKIILPLPETKLQNFVHWCDYLGSRKCLEYNFNVGAL